MYALHVLLPSFVEQSKEISIFLPTFQQCRQKTQLCMRKWIELNSKRNAVVRVSLFRKAYWSYHAGLNFHGPSRGMFV